MVGGEHDKEIAIRGLAVTTKGQCSLFAGCRVGAATTMAQCRAAPSRIPLPEQCKTRRQSHNQSWTSRIKPLSGCVPNRVLGDLFQRSAIYRPYIEFFRIVDFRYFQEENLLQKQRDNQNQTLESKKRRNNHENTPGMCYYTAYVYTVCGHVAISEFPVHNSPCSKRLLVHGSSQRPKSLPPDTQ